jgi:hypothetical protein
MYPALGFYGNGPVVVERQPCQTLLPVRQLVATQQEHRLDERRVADHFKPFSGPFSLAWIRATICLVSRMRSRITALPPSPQLRSGV